MYDLMRRDAGSLCGISLPPTARLRLRHVLRAPLRNEGQNQLFGCTGTDKINLGRAITSKYPNPGFMIVSQTTVLAVFFSPRHTRDPEKHL